MTGVAERDAAPAAAAVATLALCAVLAPDAARANDVAGLFVPSPEGGLLGAWRAIDGTCDAPVLIEEAAAADGTRTLLVTGSGPGPLESGSCRLSAIMPAMGGFMARADCGDRGESGALIETGLRRTASSPPSAALTLAGARREIVPCGS